METRTIEKVAREFCKLRGIAPDAIHPDRKIPQWQHELNTEEIKRMILLIAAFERVSRAEHLAVSRRHKR